MRSPTLSQPPAREGGANFLRTVVTSLRSMAGAEWRERTADRVDTPCWMRRLSMTG